MITSAESICDNKALKELLVAKSQTFWDMLRDRTLQAQDFEDLFFLSTLRRKAIAQQLAAQPGQRSKLKLALIGGYTLHPLCLLLEQTLFAHKYDVEIWMGEYDNYVAEILDESSHLYSFCPDLVFLIPPVNRFRYSGKLFDAKELVEAEIERKTAEIFSLCEQIHLRSGAEVILSNFMLPCYFDPGPLRARTVASEWSSLKLLNLEIGLKAPGYVHVCDLEFLAARLGGLYARDDRAWFESKQPFSADFACQVAKEFAQIVASLKTPSKKVLVCDLDETLWGGVIAEDGLNGIELGDTSSRGQCYKHFQSAIRELSDRGVLLAVCSKNDVENAKEPFERHPEMVLRMEDIASFAANWNPKSDNMVKIGQELDLGLDSFVFIDDNPAEIDIVRQFASDVATIWLGSDPALYLQRLLDCRYFETRQVTEEDTKRAGLYRLEQQRKSSMAVAGDFDSYLESLQMVADIASFKAVDVPRITQLINKSNQFNLTTKRRSEADVANLVNSDAICLSVRLTDRFGELGLISVMVATQKSPGELAIDTWLMSCRVLKRQVEHAVMNTLMDQARKRGYERVFGTYIPSPKNQMVRDFYPAMGFKTLSTSDESSQFEMLCADFEPFSTKITINQID